MPLKQDDSPPKGPRPFTNRKDEIDRFWYWFYRLKEQEYSVLSFYGVGGVGKTRLRQELIEQVRDSPWAKETILSFALDFDTRDKRPSLRDVERALLAIRNELHRQGVAFRSFDIAYAHYWEMTHPEVALQQRDIPFINEGSAIIELFGGGKDLFESLQDFSTWIVGAGMLPKALTLITSLGKVGKNWLAKRAIERLQELNTVSVGQLINELIYFIAYDIRAYQEVNPNQRLVFFIDTYEALWWETLHSRSIEHWLEADEWIRHLIAELPYTLWVISGRNQLRWKEIEYENWDEYVDEVLLGEWSEKDSERYLLDCGLTEPTIIQRILISSMGLPFALELQVDQYERILKIRQPVVKDFTKHHNKLIQRFTEYLTLAERQTLKVLSVARVWDSELFHELIYHFQTGYPATALAELSIFSFIAWEDNQYRMHELMREELQKALDTPLIDKYHEFFFNYYAWQLDSIDPQYITSNYEFVWEEAFYHKINTYEMDLYWFFDLLAKFIEGSKWDLCLRLCLELENLWVSQDRILFEEDFGCLLSNIGKIYENKVDYVKSLNYFQQALTIFKSTLGEKHTQTATVLQNIAIIYWHQGLFGNSLEYALQALTIFKSTLGEQHLQTAKSLDSVGVIYGEQGQYDEALYYFQEALLIRLKVLGIEHFDTARSIHNIGAVYGNQNLKDKSLYYYQQALAIRLKVLGERHPDTAHSLNSIGNIYSEQGQYDDALDYYFQALDIRQKELGEQHPDTARSLHCIGIAYDEQGQLDKALIYYLQALDICQTVIGEQHPLTVSVKSKINDPK